MTVLQRVVKPTTRRGKQFLEDREPKVVENTKKVLLVKGKKQGEIGVKVLEDFHKLKRPDSIKLSFKNDVLPFDDASFFEHHGRRKAANLFVFASHNKKRPHNIVIGRLFDHQLLDMVELGCEKYTSIQEFKVEKVDSGLKPCLIFNGDHWSQSEDYKRLQNMLADLFHREPVETISLQNIEHVISFTAVNDLIYMRSYKIQFKKSGQKTPRVELEEIGPSADFKLRRTKLASSSLFKEACKQPKELIVKKKKNITKDKLGTTHGRLHVPKQEIEKLQTRKMKGLKKSMDERKSERAALKKRRAAAEKTSQETPRKKLRSS